MYRWYDQRRFDILSKEELRTELATPDGFEEATYCASPGHPARADSIIRTNEIATFHREEEQDERRRRRRVDRNRRLRVKEHRKLLRRDAVWRAMWDGVPLDEHFFEQFPDCSY